MRLQRPLFSSTSDSMLRGAQHLPPKRTAEQRGTSRTSLLRYPNQFLLMDSVISSVSEDFVGKLLRIRASCLLEGLARLARQLSWEAAPNSLSSAECSVPSSLGEPCICGVFLRPIPKLVHCIDYDDVDGSPACASPTPVHVVVRNWRPVVAAIVLLCPLR